MIKKIENKDDNILDYIGQDYGKCLYLYLDYLKYGVNNANIKVWIQKNINDNITSVILMYYTGMHIFSKNEDCNYEELLKLIAENNPSIICSTKNVINGLNKFPNNYTVEYGWIRELSSIDEKYNLEDVKKATDKEFLDIAKLLYTDYSVNSTYSFDNLLMQIKIRNNENYGRNYYINFDNKIVAHAGTGAENDKLAILNYVITDINYRGQGLATKVAGKVCYDLIKEGKKVYLINYTKESTGLYEKLGFKVLCEYGKLYLEDK